MPSSFSKITPCIWLDDQAEQAAAFYVRTLPGGGRITATSRYPESSENPSGKPPGSVLTVEFEVGGQSFTALNGGPQFTLNPSISFFLHVDTDVDAERLFSASPRGDRSSCRSAPTPGAPGTAGRRIASASPGR